MCRSSGYPLLCRFDDDAPLQVPKMIGVKTLAEDVVCLLVTRDPTLIDAVSATALALGAPVEVVTDREELRALWPDARVRLVGVDMLARAAEFRDRTGGTWVVGKPDALLLAASAELGAPALALPQSAQQLAEVLVRGREPEPSATVVALVGGCGGVGTSSLTVATALLAAERGQSVAVIELAECGGGLDLMMGLEAAPGVRWGDLGDVSGELGRLDQQLVTGDGVVLLALSRDTGAPPTRGALEAVLRSLGRSQDLIVVDAGDGERLDWLAGAQPIIVVAAHVRGVAAGRMVVERHGSSRAQLLVRTGPGASLPTDAVAQALGLPLLGTIRNDPAVFRLAATGASVAARPARRFRRDVNAFVDRLLT